MKCIVSSILALFCIFKLSCFSQPANDECNTARVLLQTYVCSPITATTENATQSLPPLVCSGMVGYSDDDVWFSFVATTSHVTIEVDGSPGFDAIVDFRESPCDGTPIACIDATGPGGTELISKTGLYIGNVYLIRVYSYGNGASAQGTFTICAYGMPPYPPVNDDCTGAIWMLELPTCQPFTATTVSADQSVAPVFCDGNTGYADDDVWFIFRATTSDPEITVTGTPLFDAVIDLRTSDCNGTTLFCSDSSGAGGTENLLTSGLIPSELYHIRVYGYGNGPNDEGEFSICVSESEVTGIESVGGSGIVHISPNPFSDTFIISYTLREKSRVQIMIYNLWGSEIATIADEIGEPGLHELKYNPSRKNVFLENNVFFCIVTIGADQIVKKIFRLPQ